MSNFKIQEEAKDPPSDVHKCINACMSRLKQYARLLVSQA